MVGNSVSIEKKEPQTQEMGRNERESGKTGSFFPEQNRECCYENPDRRERKGEKGGKGA